MQQASLLFLEKTVTGSFFFGRRGTRSKICLIIRHLPNLRDLLPF
nr:MAG TPA: hypothetical protein [Caudoviricetes sp.]